MTVFKYSSSCRTKSKGSTRGDAGFSQDGWWSSLWCQGSVEVHIKRTLKLALDELYSGKPLWGEPPQGWAKMDKRRHQPQQERWFSRHWLVVLGSVRIKENNVDTDLSQLSLVHKPRMIMSPVSAMGLFALQRAFGHSRVLRAGLKRFPLQRWRNQGSERLSVLPEVTQLGRVRAGIHLRAGNK